jgi:hypothetical protein
MHPLEFRPCRIPRPHYPKVAVQPGALHAVRNRDESRRTLGMTRARVVIGTPWIRRE